jgi:hypothetical protein
MRAALSQLFSSQGDKGFVFTGAAADNIKSIMQTDDFY